MSLIAQLFMVMTLTSVHADCDFEKGKSILDKTKREHTVVWSIQNTSQLNERFSSEDKIYSRYLKWVHAHTSWSPQENIKNHIKVGNKIVANVSPTDPFITQVQRNNRNSERILNGEVGRIRPMTCLESIPFRELLKFVDLRKDAKEMYSTILQKDDEIKIIANFDYEKSKENGASGTTESAAAEKLRLSLLKEGWVLAASYHNHPFWFDNPYGDIGGQTAPSDPDIQSYLQHQPQSAIISNGIDTIIIDKADYSKFEL